jgi:hypothetical protein
MDGGRDEALLAAVFALMRRGVGDSVFTEGPSNLVVGEGSVGESPGETGASLTSTPLGFGEGADLESAGGEGGERDECDQRSKKPDTVLAHVSVSQWFPLLRAAQNNSSEVYARQ